MVWIIAYSNDQFYGNTSIRPPVWFTKYHGIYIDIYRCLNSNVRQNDITVMLDIHIYLSAFATV